MSIETRDEKITQLALEFYTVLAVPNDDALFSVEDLNDIVDVAFVHAAVFFHRSQKALEAAKAEVVAADQVLRDDADEDT